MQGALLRAAAGSSTRRWWQAWRRAQPAYRPGQHQHCRAVASSAHKRRTAGQPDAVNATAEAEPVAESSAPLHFELLPPEAPLFPELLTPGTRAVLIGIDPDIHGALAVLQWDNPPAPQPSARSSASSNSGSSNGSSSDNASALNSPPLASLQLGLHDMPVEIWELGTREKRQPAASELIALLQQCLTGDEHVTASGSSSSNVSSDAACSAAGEPDAHVSDAAAAVPAPRVVRAVVEYSQPLHMSGKHAWYGIGFSMGLLNGLLVSKGIPYQRVHSASWKRQMGLFKAGKEGSLALARLAFPAAAQQYLRRKKDHGRAEALLVAAWGLGLRASPRAASALQASTVDGSLAEHQGGALEQQIEETDQQERQSSKPAKGRGRGRGKAAAAEADSEGLAAALAT